MSQSNKFLQVLEIAKERYGWTKSQLGKQARLAPSQMQKMSKQGDAIYACRQSTRDNIAKAVQIDVTYLNDKSIPLEDFEAYLSDDPKITPVKKAKRQRGKRATGRKSKDDSKSNQPLSGASEAQSIANQSKPNSNQLLSPQYLNSPTKRLETHIAVMAELTDMFKRHTGDGVSVDEFMDSIKQFATMLVKPNSNGN